MIRKLSYILLPILVVFLMSHNAFADTITESSGSGVYGYVVRSSSGDNYGRNASWSGNYPVELLSPRSGTQVIKYLYGVQKSWNLNLPTGKQSYSVSARFIITAMGNNEIFYNLPITGTMGTTSGTKNMDCAAGNGGSSVNQVVVECISSTTGGVRPTSVNITYGSTVSFDLSSNYISYVSDTSSRVVVASSSYTYSAAEDNSAAVVNGLDQVRQSVNYQGDKINNSINNLNNSINEQNKKENAAVDNIQNQTTGDIPNSTDQQTTNLIGLFGSFVSAVSSASATNCNIVANFGNLNLGTLNLCQDNPPAFIQVIGSIVLIVILVPCAYWLVMRILGEIRSFTNG